MKKAKVRDCSRMPINTYEGETIENKVRRIVDNKEPINDGAPIIYTMKADGVIKAYNIRTDRWEIAQDAMDAVNKTIIAKSEGAPTKTEPTTKPIANASEVNNVNAINNAS